MNKRISSEVLELNKKSSIYHIKELDRLKSWEYCFAHWETFLTSDYWKNWQKKIQEFQSQVAMDFYVNRLSALMDFIFDCSKKVDGVNMSSVSELIKREEKRLEIISSEDFKKEDKFADVGFKELSTQEILNDPWFSNEIDKFFGLNGKSSNEVNVVYTNGKKNDKLTKNLLEALRERTISEISTIKADETLTSSEKQEKLKENQLKLERLQSILRSLNNNNPWPIIPIISTIGLVALLGLIIYKVRKKKNNSL